MTKIRTHWQDKPYYSLDYYLKQQYGEKVYRLSLNAGLTCPNRDGTLDNRGCIFCSRGGSGDFASPACQSVTEQIEDAKKRRNIEIGLRKIRNRCQGRESNEREQKIFKPFHGTMFQFIHIYMLRSCRAVLLFKQ